MFRAHVVLDEGPQVVSDDLLVEFFLFLTDEVDDIFGIEDDEFVWAEWSGVEFGGCQCDWKEQYGHGDEWFIHALEVFVGLGCYSKFE